MTKEAFLSQSGWLLINIYWNIVERKSGGERVSFHITNITGASLRNNQNILPETPRLSGRYGR